MRNIVGTQFIASGKSCKWYAVANIFVGTGTARPNGREASVYICDHIWSPYGQWYVDHCLYNKTDAINCVPTKNKNLLTPEP